MTWLINFVQGSGLRVGSTSGGNHVQGSYHFRHRALDMYGPPERMMALARRALARPLQFREVFYDPAGRYVKNGEVRSGSIGGHRDHVHLAR